MALFSAAGEGGGVQNAKLLIHNLLEVRLASAHLMRILYCKSIVCQMGNN